MKCVRNFNLQIYSQVFVKLKKEKKKKKKFVNLYFKHSKYVYVIFEYIFVSIWSVNNI